MVQSDADYSEIASSNANDLQKVITPSTLFDQELKHHGIKTFYDDPYVRISETVFQDNKESDPSSAAISVLRRPDRVIIDLSKQTTFFNQAKRVEED
ncbi:MAG: hypothetical protein ACK521_09750 [bacterium]